MAAKKTPRKVSVNLTAEQKAASAAFKAHMSQNMLLPEIDGIVFRWVNPEHRSRVGWKIWAPVLQDSELGQAVNEFLDTLPVSAIRREDSNFFHAGVDQLAFSTTELVEELRAHNRKRANDQLDQVIAEHGSKRRIRRLPVHRLEAEE